MVLPPFSPPRDLVAMSGIDIALIDSIAIKAGRRTEDPSAHATYVRDLGLGDLDLVLNPPKIAKQAKSIQKIRTTHHALARVLAEGAKDVDASAITGFSTKSITNLRADPAFQELLNHYMDNESQKTADYRERLLRLGMTAAEELQDRLEEDPEKFGNKELRELMKDSVVLANPGAQMNTNPAGAPTHLKIEFVGAKPQGGATPVIDLDHEEIR